MALPGPDRRVVEHVAATTGLTPGEAARVVADVLAYHREPVEDLVRRRHAELHAGGRRNQEIFDLLAAELSGRVVAAPALTPRQLRRMVYG